MLVSVLLNAECFTPEIQYFMATSAAAATIDPVPQSKPPLINLFHMEKWSKHGIGTLLYWAGLQLYPWSVADEQLHDALTKIGWALYGATVDLSDQHILDTLSSHVSLSFRRHSWTH